jgi:hypothetical protein
MDDLSNALTSWTRRLVACPPFDGLAEHEVRDVRPGGSRAPRIHACPERPLLLDGLAGALLMWESASATAARLAFLSSGLDELGAMLDYLAAVWADLPRSGFFLGVQAARHRSFLRQTRAYRDAVRELEPVHRVQAGQQLPGTPFHDARSLTLKTVQMMDADFRALGPPDFSQEARFRALAAILEPLGVHNTQGKPFTAAGIKKLFQRDPSMKDMYCW